MSFTVQPCTKYLGAEIGGVDLSRTINTEIFATIDQTYAKHGVIFFRNQEISPDQQIAFSGRFGEVGSFPLAQYSLEGHPEILLISNIQKNDENVGLADAGQTWHTDMSWSALPPRGTALYAKEIPINNGEVLGDTLFASADAAYDALSDAMKKRIKGLKAIHSYHAKHAYRAKVGTSDREEMNQDQKDAHPDVLHPVVRTHPLTGRKCLYVMTGECVGIEGMPEDEALALLDELATHTVKPKFQYRHKWQVGDFLIWDNCSVQHLAVRDYELPLRRMMHRTQFAGSRPF
ncbi:MAG: TauD/TfdA family dioxygenase [Rhodospirillaceae bacterium]|jgi:taurine dioxygenase|nr:TauD/TfdA family dioxygenase [Rhodospirillales bacterium]MBT3904172.1 TauD/TfdA family dioxygenase [Rhodospirillaceae bacterium]MBT4701936.1 TauD/TfdA family dioxygenase [Rhodospirillaceae bacterium]MBT5035428.1 TauD/TfdA family dioxygenase [Rhodospirillaceae bacterium]MBT6218570.1 TauD/TfdA family dioxygenase [Rhodospirillaceae bacterium]